MPYKWTTVERPGYFGKKRDQKYAEWDRLYGSWRIAWYVNGHSYDFLGACALYEDAYLEFLKDNPNVLEELVSFASEVYDIQPTNVHSGLDYTKQECDATHIQDIAIRRSLVRLATWFRGLNMLQIRDKAGIHPLSMTLSLGRVPFHHPEWIKQPQLTGWWLADSVESFYQSNKVLQVRELAAR